MTGNRINFCELRSNLERLGKRVSDLPVAAILLSRLLLHAGRGMSNLLDKEIRPYGLAEVEFRVLTTLFSYADGAAHPGELCCNTSQSPANMSRISDALVARDLVTRVTSVQDRRKMVLRITPQGEELVQRLLPALSIRFHDMFDSFSDAEQLLLQAQLQRLVAKLDGAVPEASPDLGDP